MARIDDIIKDKAAKRLEMETCVRIETQAQFYKVGEYVIAAAPAGEADPFYVAQVIYIV